MSDPEVTVLMPIFNAEAWLDRAVGAIVVQTFANWRMLLLDDGSTDRSPVIGRAWEERDPRIRLVTSGANCGVAAVLNRGLAMATTPFIARMDADDEALPDRFERQLSRFATDPDLVLLGTSAVDLLSGKPTFRVPLRHEEIRAALLFNAALLHPSVMWRRVPVEAAGLRYSEEPTAEDYDLWVRISDRFRTANLADRLLRYRTPPPGRDTPYRRQQREGARRIRAERLAWLGLNPDQEERGIHDALAYDEEAPPAYPVAGIDVWLEKIVAANRAAARLEPVVLHRRLEAQRYYYFARSPHRFSLREAFCGGGVSRCLSGLGWRYLLRWVRQ